MSFAETLRNLFFLYLPFLLFKQNNDLLSFVSARLLLLSFLLCSIGCHLFPFRKANPPAVPTVISPPASQTPTPPKNKNPTRTPNALTPKNQPASLPVNPLPTDSSTRSKANQSNLPSAPLLSSSHEESPVSASGILTLRPVEVIKQTVHGVDLIFVCYDDRAYQLQVLDQKKGPNSQWATATLAGQKHGALAALNGGFFTPEGTPLGLVISKHHTAGVWNTVSSLCSGVFIQDSSGARLMYSSSWNPANKAQQLLQSGPFLIQHNQPVSGLKDGEDRARSFLVWNGKHEWALGYTRSASLPALAQALASKKIKGIHVRHALNLDGGRSSDLWVSPLVQNGPLSARLWWNRPVRNFLVLTKKLPF